MSKTTTIATGQMQPKIGTIKNLPSYHKQFLTGKLERRVGLDLTAALLKLHDAKTIVSDESAMLELLLKKERTRGSLSDKDIQTLNWIEIEKCDQECRCINDSQAAVLFIKKDEVYRFFRNPDTDRYSVFVKYVVPVSHQMPLELIEKENRGHFGLESEYPKPRTDIRLLELNEKFFKNYFEIAEDSLEERTKHEEDFKF